MNLDEIEARAQKATPGPWVKEGREVTGRGGVHFVITTDPGYHVWATQADLDFIAHARKDVPRLISEIRRMSEKIAWLEKDRLRLKDELDEDDHSQRFDVPGIDY